MRKSKADPRVLDHLEWLGFVKPVGLVVSAPALVRAGAILNRRDSAGQCALRDLIDQDMAQAKSSSRTINLGFEAFAREVLGWNFSPGAYVGLPHNPVPDELATQLSDGGPTIVPDFAVRELEPKEGASNWQLLVQVLESEVGFDKIIEGKNQVELSAHGRMERLLRKHGVGAGLLFNGKSLRLISAPKGESSGWLDFSIADMVSTAGRPICTAMRMLLGQERLLSLPKAKRLPALLEDSRKFQNEVSERLAEQVLEGLYEFLRGFQAAHDASKGELLKEVLEGDPDVVYRALLTVILRMVFLLYAEERDMLPQDETFLRYYSVAGLHERLREDAALNPDTMDQRFGAWAQLVVLFRMVYDGAKYPGGHLPKRHGDLFDPKRFPFLEGRKGPQAQTERMDIPLVPDGTIYRVLEKLLVLDGERLSYRALDVEQIGSVYETMMGFQVDTATGRSIAIKSEKRHGAPTTINLEELLAEASVKREKWLQDNAGRKLSDAVKKGVKDAATLDGLHAALHKVVDLRATPDIVPPGSLILQPSEARRKSGSHYTPRSLTEPIVQKTFEPIFMRLAIEATGDENGTPKPEQILDLKVCDPAMGSGAFLVEACRQLAEALIEAWRVHGGRPEIPADEDEVIFARRLVAQRCLYGVDKNPMAVDLAKVSLWLATLAKDHAFTFLDHSLKCGDSLVGLSNKQILAMTWANPEENPLQPLLLDETLPDRIRQSAKVRSKIAEASEEEYDELVEELANASQYVNDLRLVGDAVIAAFFSAEKPRDRLKALAEVREQAKVLFSKPDLSREQEQRSRLQSWSDWIGRLPNGFTPLHWDLEFPEVSSGVANGFDAMVGNPPFLGGSQLSDALGDSRYQEFLKASFEFAFGNTDLCAYFFRKAHSQARYAGTYGFLGTKTLAEGSTRLAGLKYIVDHGGAIYCALDSLEWPGEATVTVSVVHVIKDARYCDTSLNGHSVERINSRLKRGGESEDPHELAFNQRFGFFGTKLGSAGFIIEAAEYLKLSRNPDNDLYLWPCLNGDDINSSPTQTFSRYAINFGSIPLDEAERFPDLLAIVSERVKPAKEAGRDHGPGNHGRKFWWQFTLRADPLYRAIAQLERCIALARTTKHICFTFQNPRHVFTDSLVVIAFDSWAAIAVLQSEIHVQWSAFHASRMGATYRYSVTDCFHTFPLPNNLGESPQFEQVGAAYFALRADLMIRNNEGLTKIYNRFHDPEVTSPDILRLRELHAEMDRAVLDAYGWTDIPTKCEFILDYEDDVEEEGGGKRKKKKPWRYRWPDEVRDEVLARLLELNKERYEEEVRLGLHAKGKAKPKGTKGPEDQASLLGDENG